MRAHFIDYIWDTSGNAQANVTVNLYRPGTTTAISDTMYASRDTSSLVPGNAAKTLLSNADGKIECYFDIPGTDIPGIIRVYSTIPPRDELRMIQPSALDIPSVGTPDFIVLYDDERSTPIYVAESQTRGIASTAANADPAVVIEAAWTALTSGGIIAIKSIDDLSCLTQIDSQNVGVSLVGPQWGEGGAGGGRLLANAAMSNLISITHAGCQLRNLSLQGSTNATNVVLWTGDAGRLIDCAMRGSATTILDWDSDRGWLVDCRIAHVGGASATNNTFIRGADGFVTNCRFVSGGVTNGVLQIPGNGQQITGCHITGDGGGGPNPSAQLVRSSAARNAFENCIFDSTGVANSVEISGGANKIIGCHWMNMAAADNLYSAIAVLAGDLQVITNNSFHCDNSPSPPDASSTRFQYILEKAAGSSVVFNNNMGQAVSGPGSVVGTGLWDNRPENDVIDCVFDDKPTSKSGSLTTLTGSTAGPWNIPHGLFGTPRFANVGAANAAARGQLMSWTVDATNIIVTFAASVTDPDFWWEARM